MDIGTITIIIIIVLLASGVAYSKDIFHPAVIVNGLWGTILVLYHILDHPLWSLSQLFYHALLIWIIPFSLITLASTKYYFKSSENHRLVESKFSQRILPLVIIFCILSIVGFLYYAKGNLVALRILLVSENFPFYIEVIFYFSTFLLVYFIYMLLRNRPINKWQIFFILLLLLLVSLLKSNKTSFLGLLVSIGYVLKKKNLFKIKYIFAVIVVFAVLISLVTVNRGDWDFNSDGGIANYLYIYLLSPLTSFDLLLNQEVDLGTALPGESVGIFFYKLINLFGCNLNFSNLGIWVNVPLPTNVFTAMRAFYLDGGFWGIGFGSVLLGLIWSILYIEQKGRNVFMMVFYACMLPSLCFQTFGDYFFYSFSMTLQYLIFSYILFRGLRLSGKGQWLQKDHPMDCTSYSPKSRINPNDYK